MEENCRWKGHQKQMETFEKVEGVSKESCGELSFRMCGWKMGNSRNGQISSLRIWGFLLYAYIRSH